MSDNKFYYSNKKTQMKGFRGYFKLQKVLNAKYKDVSSAGVKLYVNFDETAIDKVNAEIAIEGIFDMSGRKLNEMPKTKGVYIINGKKVLKK